MPNKEIYLLDDKQWLIEQRQKMSAQTLAKILNCSRGSIDWAERLIPRDIKATFVSERQGKRVKAAKISSDQ